MTKEELIASINSKLTTYATFFEYGKFNLKKHIVGTKTTILQLQKSLKWLTNFEKYATDALKMWKNQKEEYWLRYVFIHKQFPEIRTMNVLIRNLKMKLGAPPSNIKNYKGKLVNVTDSDDKSNSDA